MRVSALLFDLDGTLADSDPLHLEAFQAVLGPDRPLSSETYRREIMGRTNPAIFAELFPDRPQDQAALADEKEARFRALIPALKPVAGAGALLDWADRAGVPALLSLTPAAGDQTKSSAQVLVRPMSTELPIKIVVSRLAI